MLCVRKPQREDRCEKCSRKTDHLVQFNDVLFCANCFGKEMTAFAEGRTEKPDIAQEESLPITLGIGLVLFEISQNHLQSLSMMLS